MPKPRYFADIGSNDFVVLFDIREATLLNQGRKIQDIHDISYEWLRIARDILNNHTRISFRHSFCRTIGYPFFCGIVAKTDLDKIGLGQFGVACLSAADFVTRVNEFCVNRDVTVPRTYIFKLPDSLFKTFKDVLSKEIISLPCVKECEKGYKFYQIMINPQLLTQIKEKFPLLQFTEIAEEITLEDLPPADKIVEQRLIHARPISAEPEAKRSRPGFLPS